MAKVGIVMGSDSDMPVMAKAADISGLRDLPARLHQKCAAEKAARA